MYLLTEFLLSSFEFTGICCLCILWMQQQIIESIIVCVRYFIFPALKLFFASFFKFSGGSYSLQCIVSEVIALCLLNHCLQEFLKLKHVFLVSFSELMFSSLVIWQFLQPLNHFSLYFHGIQCICCYLGQICLCEMHGLFKMWAFQGFLEGLFVNMPHALYLLLFLRCSTPSYFTWTPAVCCVNGITEPSMMIPGTVSYVATSDSAFEVEDFDYFSLFQNFHLLL